MHNGDDLNYTDYPLMLRSNQTTSRPFRRELLDFKFPVDTSDLRVHVLIGYLEEAVKRPLRYYRNDDDSYSDDSSECEDDNEEEDMITKIQKYSSIGCFFTEKDGTQEPYQVRVRFSFSRLSDCGLPDDDEDDEERSSEITSLETKKDNELAELENFQLEDIPEVSKGVW
ncbi:uncharacterized protein [Argopecten irradians]|uniref:uncharacterized protein n=1 Tax=Argopecten irradians TaxID=31199 RepID=UPI003714EE61